MAKKQSTKNVDFKVTFNPTRNGLHHCSDRCEGLTAIGKKVRCRFFDEDLVRDSRRKVNAVKRSHDCIENEDYTSNEDAEIQGGASELA